jgi:hypothetical protein
LCWLLLLLLWKWNWNKIIQFSSICIHPFQSNCWHRIGLIYTHTHTH